MRIVFLCVAAFRTVCDQLKDRNARLDPKT